MRLVRMTAKRDLHDLLDFHLKHSDLPRPPGLLHHVLVHVVDGQHPALHRRHVRVLEEDHPVCVLDNGRCVACKEIFNGVAIFSRLRPNAGPAESAHKGGFLPRRALHTLDPLGLRRVAKARNRGGAVLHRDGVALKTRLGFDADDHRGASPRGNGLTGEDEGLEDASKGSFQLRDCLFNKLTERGARTLAVNMLDQLCHRLRVRVGLKCEALRHEELLDLLVVGDDPVVNDHKLVVLA